jgi:MFS family permease
MSTTDISAEAEAGTNRLGLYLAFLQLAFTLLWTTYVIFLPKLATGVGIAPRAVIFLLMMDQAIFMISDTAMGIAADRIARFFGRLGPWIGVLTAISCAAFVALPFVTGPNAKAIFIGLIVIWAITSSALRAPPLILLGQHASKPRVPFLAAVVMLGYGLAGAVSPYLGVLLRDYDARMPFIIATIVLLITALGLSQVGPGLGQQSTQEGRQAKPVPLRGAPMLFIVATVILALGYQLHFSVNTEFFYLRVAKSADLQWLMPVFWIGFNIAMFPASVIVKHRGALIVMAVAGLLGAIAISVTEITGALNVMVVAQFVAGAAWGCMMMSAISAALWIGMTGAQGKVTGLVFSALALATCARMSAVAGGLQKMPDYAPLVHWAPVACWLVAGTGLLVITAARMRGKQVQI